MYLEVWGNGGPALFLLLIGTYGVNLKQEEKIVFSRILASFAFDPPHMKLGKVVAAETTPGELCKVRIVQRKSYVVPGLCKVPREWSCFSMFFRFLMWGVKSKGAKIHGFFVN